MTVRAHFRDDEGGSFEVQDTPNSKDLRHSSSNGNTSSRMSHKPSKDLDMDEVFNPFGRSDDDVSEFFSHESDSDEYEAENPNRIFNDPKESAVLDGGVHQIPGSPWAKPATKPSNRPTDPLAIASISSTIALALAVGWVVVLFVMAVLNHKSVGRIILEMILALIAFFGLYWNSYFTVSSIFKCFIPSKAFRTNTKYCSMIPEEKPPNERWLDVTMQIPVYKESLQEVMIPTLKSCIKSRDYYRRTGAQCNIVMCDDGMMALLKDNFAAAEMLWETIESTEGRVFKLSELLKKVPRPSRRHMKGQSSSAVYEVFHRMLFYYHYDVGFVARSTLDRRGKFKKASNLNSHLQLVWGAQQIAEAQNMAFDQALMRASHNNDGSRFIMFGGNIAIGDLILINDADARMAETVIAKTVPEFINDQHLGFTQHATKTLDDQRGESYYLNMLSVYTDALYQGHFLLSSILGCHPPLVGHSIFLRSEAVKQCGRIRTLRKTQRWLNNIGLPFLSIDQVGLANLNDNQATEYWSENHVSEDFELMIHFYNLGFNGRYVAYPNCEFQEGITRTFDEEAGRHRKFALGAHELMFNPFNNWIGGGIFTKHFRTFLSSNIPSYYKIFLTAYLFSYTSGGTYIIVFSIAAMARLIGREHEVMIISSFNSAGVLVLSILVYYIIGYGAFLIAMVRMRWSNRNLLFPEYGNRSALYLCYKMIRYSMTFQILFYSVMVNYFFLGSMDHLLAKRSVVSATNKDSITVSRCSAFIEVVKFNCGSWALSICIIALAYVTWLQIVDWDLRAIPDLYNNIQLNGILFAAPAALMAIMAFLSPIILNPYVVGWPFNPPFCGLGTKPDTGEKHKNTAQDDGNLELPPSGRKLDLEEGEPATKLKQEAGRVKRQHDVEIGSGSGRKKYPEQSLKAQSRRSEGKSRRSKGKPRRSKHSRGNGVKKSRDRDGQGIVELGPASNKHNSSSSPSDRANLALI